MVIISHIGTSLLYRIYLFEKVENKMYENQISKYDCNVPKGENDQRLLFEFSIRVGAIITYILIKVMSNNLIRGLTYAHKISGRYLETEFIDKWINNVISPVKLLKELKITIDKSSHYCSREPRRNQDRSAYELNKDRIKQLSDAFDQLYPKTYSELEEIHSKLPKPLEINLSYLRK